MVSVKSEAGADPAKVHLHLERLLKSDLLRRSASLTQLLQYLVVKSLQADGEHLKESVIAIEVFHRSGDFDSRLDNIVRVHAHRLRKLLDTWYQGEGAREEIRFVIPRGSYMLQIEANEGTAAFEHTQHEPEAAVVPAAAVKRSYPLGALASGVLLGALGVYAALFFSGHTTAWNGPARSSEDSLSRGPLAALWKSVFRTGANTVVSYTNPAFLRTSGWPRLYLTYKGPLNAPNGTRLHMGTQDAVLDSRLLPFGPFYFSDSWTGTGEVMAVQKLTELSANSGYHFRLMRSRALTYNEVKNANVIFIGSPWANDMQAKFNTGGTPFQCYGTEKVVNNSPRDGEPAAYYSESNGATNELATTYGIFSVLPGVGPGTKIVSSSGIDTYATFAALDLMTTANGVREAMRRFGTLEKQSLPDYFQAVIRTEMIRGEPANASIVAVREVTPKSSGEARR
jgi:hypothetical protein